MGWRRHLRYFFPVPFVAFLLFAALRVGYIVGYWPDVNEVHSETLALIGVCLAGCTAYDIARHDVDYLRTISSTPIRLSWYLCGLGALVYNVGTIVVLYAVCLSGDPGGSPWWSIPVMGVIWSLFSVGLGGAVGRSLHTKLRLAAIVGFIAGMAVVVLTLMAGMLRVVPKILFLRPYSSGNYVGYVEESVQLRPVVVGAVVGIVLAAVLIFVTMADCVRDKKLLSLALSGIVIFSVVATLVGINGPLVTVREKPSNPSCTRSADGARYCSWPEDESTVREVDKNWSAFCLNWTRWGSGSTVVSMLPKKLVAISP
jgi:putative membrane protein